MGALWVGGCNSDREIAGPEPGGLPPELLGSAIQLRVNMKAGKVTVESPSLVQEHATTPGLKPSFALLGRNEVTAETGTVTRSSVGEFTPNRVRVSFDLTLTSNLENVDLVPSTFPSAPIQQVVAFPFATEPAGLFGLKVRASPDWDGAPHNFFNDPVNIVVTPPGDWFRWEGFGATIGPDDQVSRRVGFDVDPSVSTFTMYVVVAADLRDREVTLVNRAPTLDPVPDPEAILEEAGQQTVNLTGISAGAGETQTLTVTATSSNPGLIPNPTVSYTSPAVTGSLTYTPVANQSGSSVIIVTVQDDGGTANSGISTTSRSFTVTVSPVNDAPTLDAIPSTAPISEDAGPQTIDLAGISAGGGETQQLTVTATSNSTSLIPDPTVSYTSPGATGSLTYTPVANQSGTASLTVTVRDGGLDGLLGNAEDATVSRTFIVTVTPGVDANAEPTINAIPNPAAILEDAGQQTVNLSGISAGPGETQTLTVTAISSNLLIPNPTVSYTSPAATGSLTYTPVANQSGSATITVFLQDNGGTANGGINSTSRVFIVEVIPVNDAPTLDPVTNPATIPLNAGPQTINLTGISAGGGESQPLAVTAVSTNQALIPTPAVSYSSPDATGSLTYTPSANQAGSAIISVLVRDGGGDGILGNGDDATAGRSFAVTVTPGGAVNAAPTLSAILTPAPIREDAGQQTVILTGISAGGGETQTLTVTATSGNPGLIPNPTVSYTSPDPNGSLTFTPVANQFGSAIITVTVQDDGGSANGGINTTSRTVTVTVFAVNDAPTLNPIPDPAPILEDPGAQVINLSGIAAGAGESQTLTVTATSNNLAVIPNPTVSYISPDATGTLRYTPASDRSGTAIITVRVEDDGGIANGGINVTLQSFTVTVNPVNDAPTLSPIANQTILQGATRQTVSLSTITAGPLEIQTLAVTATSNNPGLIPNPEVTYSSPNASGSLVYTPVATQSGSATITVTVRDAGLDGILGNAEDGTFIRSFTVTVTPASP